MKYTIIFAYILTDNELTDRKQMMRTKSEKKSMSFYLLSYGGQKGLEEEGPNNKQAVIYIYIYFRVQQKKRVLMITDESLKMQLYT